MLVRESLSGAELMDFLKEQSESRPLSVEGIVKLDGKELGYFLFSTSVGKVNWTQVPLELVEKVEFLGTVSFDSDSCSFVRVFLRKPAANDHYGKLLENVVSALRGNITLRQSPSNPQCDEVSRVTARPVSSGIAGEDVIRQASASGSNRVARRLVSASGNGVEVWEYDGDVRPSNGGA